MTPPISCRIGQKLGEMSGEGYRGSALWYWRLDVGVGITFLFLFR